MRVPGSTRPKLAFAMLGFLAALASLAAASPTVLARKGGEILSVAPDPDDEGQWGDFSKTCPDDVHLRHGGGGGKGADDADERKWYLRVLCLRDTGARHCSVLDLDQYVHACDLIDYQPVYLWTYKPLFAPCL